MKSFLEACRTRDLDAQPRLRHQAYKLPTRRKSALARLHADATSARAATTHKSQAALKVNTPRARKEPAKLSPSTGVPARPRSETERAFDAYIESALHNGLLDAGAISKQQMELECLAAGARDEASLSP